MCTTEFFQQVRQIPVPWRDRSLCTPTFYYDVTSIEAEFLAASARARAFLPSPRMHPWRVTPWHCLVAIAALAYRDSDIGPYNEVFIGVPITLDTPSPLFTGLLRRPPEAPLVYVRHMPVTTAIARDAGIDFLATPKYLADITFEETKGWIRCRLCEDQTSILSLAVRTGALKLVARSRRQFITARGGYLLRWEFVTSAQRKRNSHKASDVQLELGSHPIAQELRKIQLGQAVACEYAPQSQGILTHVLESFAVSDSGSQIRSTEAIA